MKDNFEINPQYSSQESVRMYTDWVQSDRTDPYVSDSAILIKEPFPAFQFRDFCSNENLLKLLMEQVDSFEFKSQETDLYCFSKTAELNDVREGIFGKFREFIYNDVREWVQDLCGLRFPEDQVDLFAAKYSHGDMLLCHDDRVSTRKIAFILYLCPGWTDEDGGKLDLISSDVTGNPTHVGKSLDIGFNVFNFFIVGPESFHQVAEVTAASKTRLSISGWFHAQEDSLLPDVRSFTTPQSVLVPFSSSLDLSLHMNSSYLTDLSRVQIVQQFEETSYVLLNSFFTPRVHNDLLESLQCLDEAMWERAGPMDIRHVDVLEGNDPILDIFKSRHLLEYLKEITQIEIGDEGHVDVWRLGRGMYTLLHNREEPFGDSLCCYFTISNKSFSSEICGGYIVFVDREEGDELVRIPNNDGNTLALVYANAGTSSFLKYINCLFGDDYFYVVKVILPLSEEMSSE